jgi:zinc/manganese transport system substrate-binding protein
MAMQTMLFLPTRPSAASNCNTWWPSVPMVRTLIKLGLSLAVLMAQGQALALTVFACEPEWAALTQTLLPSAKVYSATHHLQDPHHIEARPSLIAQLRNADMAVCTGAELEAGWLPMLQAKASNPKIQNGQPGMFYAADHVTLVNPYKGAVTPFSGDVHVLGNPHLHADPRRLLAVARALAPRLSAIAPQDKAGIERQLQQFEMALTGKIQAWEQLAKPLRGRSVVTQHANFGYLWLWLGLNPVADLEPKPGVSPTPAHLARTLELSRAAPPMAIVIAQHHDPRPAQWLSGQLGTRQKMVVLPATVTGDGPDALFAWFDLMVNRLVQVAS